MARYIVSSDFCEESKELQVIADSEDAAIARFHDKFGKPIGMWSKARAWNIDNTTSMYTKNMINEYWNMTDTPISLHHTIIIDDTCYTKGAASREISRRCYHFV